MNAYCRNTAFLGAMLGLVLAAACGGGDMDGKGRWGNRAEGEQRDPLVEVVPVRTDNIASVERCTGRVDARSFADLYAQVSEVASDVFFDVGDYVEAGRVLARLDASSLELRVVASAIALREAELAHSKARLDADKRKSELERVMKYFDPQNPETSRIYSKEQYDAAKLEFDKAENAVQTAELALTKAQGELAATQIQRGHAEIVAPISGMIIERNIRANERVNTGALLFKLADFRALEVRLEVAESSLAELRPAKRLRAVELLGLDEKPDLATAQAVLVTLTAFPDAKFIGWLDRVYPTVDTGRGMVVVTVRLIPPADLSEATHASLLEQLDPDARKSVMATAASVRGGRDLNQRPGLFAEALIATKLRRNVLLVPGAALVGDSEQIWVVTPDANNNEVGVARRVDIGRRRGVTSEGSFELLPARAARGGEINESEVVKTGDLVVVRGQSLLRDGARVRIRDLSK